jgi:heme-degrading monooxygenase HmoA
VIIRVFRARAKPGKADELGQLAEEVSIPFVDGQPGLVARYTGRGVGATGDEFVMISVWESLDALKHMTGENWESEVLPDGRLADCIEESSVQHYGAM